MRACKCDRCGTFYDVPAKGNILGFQWIMEDVAHTRTYDLCADCLDALTDFMSGAEVQVPKEVEILGDRFLAEELPFIGEEEPDDDAEEPESDSDAEDEETPIKIPTGHHGEEYVIELLKGKMPRQIADEHNISAKAVSNAINTYKTKYPEAYKKLVEKQKEESEGNA